MRWIEPLVEGYSAEAERLKTVRRGHSPGEEFREVIALAWSFHRAVSMLLTQRQDAWPEPPHVPHGQSEGSLCEGSLSEGSLSTTLRTDGYVVPGTHR